MVPRTPLEPVPQSGVTTATHQHASTDVARQKSPCPDCLAQLHAPSQPDLLWFMSIYHQFSQGQVFYFLHSSLLPMAVTFTFPQRGQHFLFFFSGGILLVWASNMVVLNCLQDACRLLQLGAAPFGWRLLFLTLASVYLIALLENKYSHTGCTWPVFSHFSVNSDHAMGLQPQSGFPLSPLKQRPCNTLVFVSVGSRTSSSCKQGFIATKNSAYASHPDEALNQPISRLPLIRPSCICRFSGLTDHSCRRHKASLVQSSYSFFNGSDWDCHPLVFRVLLLSCNIVMLLHFYPSHTASLLHFYILLCCSCKSGSAVSHWFSSLHQASEMSAISGLSFGTRHLGCPGLFLKPLVSMQKLF